MADYKLSNQAKEDLIRIYHYVVKKFGMTQDEIYYGSFFEHLDIIAKQPFSFESVHFISEGYRRCVCGTDSIYYRINDDFVEIMAIVGRQDLESLL